MDKPNDEIIAIITQNTMTGQFTLFVADDNEWKKVATGKTPQFEESETLVKT